MVECSDGTYYTGSTNDLENRLKLHNSGQGAKCLRGKRPVKLIYTKEYRYYKNVLHAERNLKKLTRKQKEELIKTNMKTIERVKIAPTDLARKATPNLSVGVTSKSFRI